MLVADHAATRATPHRVNGATILQGWIKTPLPLGQRPPLDTYHDWLSLIGTSQEPDVLPSHLNFNIHKIF
ncbi:unnamed protein product [Cyprideis torosa]|uniref:Uncharacterized protein n=1 Tax=Cyprideis torosa TaxID=163714 RepID=A0A7R8WAI1_9CRUS|nr:unnamed protein product [Cyprideis torosa]CAG0888424.1 unnamed protein product [Cyprideis torosa]